jgi:hypothetical protein
MPNQNDALFRAQIIVMDLLRDDKFAELLTKFSDIMNFLIEFADNEYPCRLG